jgi:hypothetical protein
VNSSVRNKIDIFFIVEGIYGLIATLFYCYITKQKGRRII